MIFQPGTKGHWYVNFSISILSPFRLKMGRKHFLTVRKQRCNECQILKQRKDTEENSFNTVCLWHTRFHCSQKLGQWVKWCCNHGYGKRGEDEGYRMWWTFKWIWWAARGRKYWMPANFIEMIDKLFDCMNVSSLSRGKLQRKLFVQPYWNSKDFQLLVSGNLSYYI